MNSGKNCPGIGDYATWYVSKAYCEWDHALGKVGWQGLLSVGTVVAESVWGDSFRAMLSSIFRQLEAWAFWLHLGSHTAL